MKMIKLLICFAIITLMGACSEESLDPNSIFETESPERNEFDKWLLENYTIPYNIDFKYRYDDKESDNTYKLIPADFDKSIALAKLMKHVWIESYNEATGNEEFMKQYTLRVMQLIGSPAYNSTGSIVLGTAEGGIKVTLYNVNIIDIDNPYIDVDSPFFDRTNPNSVRDLNYWYFKTMHHEFCHILNQLKEYTTDFNLVSQADYKSSDWVNLDDKDAPALGFVSGYASNEAREDFAEITSIYVSRTPEAWQKILDAGVVNGDTTGKNRILTKLGYVKDYFKTTWGIDLDVLRDIVLKRSSEVKDLDLRTLN